MDDCQTEQPCKASDEKVEDKRAYTQQRLAAEKEYEARKREKQRAYEDEIAREAYKQGGLIGFGGGNAQGGGPGGYYGGAGVAISRVTYLEQRNTQLLQQVAQKEVMIAELQKAMAMRSDHHKAVSLQLARAVELLFRASGAIHAQAELTLSQAELDAYRGLLDDINELYRAMAMPATAPAAAPMAGGMGRESHEAMEKAPSRLGDAVEKREGGQWNPDPNDWAFVKVNRK